METALYGYGGVICVFCIAAVLAHARKNIEEQKHRLFKLQTEYRNIRTDRKIFELKNGTEYPACSDPEYQELIRKEASALIYTTIHFPETYPELQPELIWLMTKMDDRRIA